MATYTVQINEQIPLGQSILSLLKSANEAVVSLVKKREKSELAYEELLNKSPLHRRLDGAFADVREMLDGKKTEKSLDDLIYELRNHKN